MYQILHSAKYWSLQKIQRFSKTNILTFEGIETEIDSTSLTHFQLYYKFLSLLHCDVTTTNSYHCYTLMSPIQAFTI
jgi:hypothetical protein